jgi:hypothetical protein
MRFLVAVPLGATKPERSHLWLGCPKLRDAQGKNRVHLRLSVPTLFMPTPPKN